MKWVHFAWRNVARNRRRSVMAITIVTTASVAVMVALGYMFAAFQGLEDQTIQGDLGHIQIAVPGHFDENADQPMEYGLTPEDVETVESVLSDIEAVDFWMPRVRFQALASEGETSVAAVGRGIEPEAEADLAQGDTGMLTGNYLPGLPTDNPDQALLATGLSDQLGLGQGDFVTVFSNTVDGSLNLVDLDISGTYTTGVPDLDERQVLTTVPAAQQLLSTDRVSRIVVVLKNNDATPAVTQQLREALPDYEIRDWRELATFYQRVVTLYTGIFSTLTLIIAVVVLLAIVNTMMMTIMERIREVGTLMAFGYSRGRLRRNFALEGGIIGAISGVLGAVIAFLIEKVINSAGIMLPPPPGQTSEVPLLIAINAPTYILTVIGVIVLGMLSAWLPAGRIVRLKIVEALGND